MTALKRRNPAGRRGFAKHRGIDATTQFYRTARGPSLPKNWRDRLPDPGQYYALHVENLGRANASGWAQGRCPFHDDKNASLSVHVADARGGWRCFASCGGGDLIGFHMRVTGKQFADAVRDLIGMRGAQ